MISIISLFGWYLFFLCFSAFSGKIFGIVPVLQQWIESLLLSCPMILSVLFILIPSLLLSIEKKTTVWYVLTTIIRFDLLTRSAWSFNSLRQILVCEIRLCVQIAVICSIPSGSPFPPSLFLYYFWANLMHSLMFNHLICIYYSPVSYLCWLPFTVDS